MLKSEATQLAKTIYHSLRKNILANAITPGTFLNERSIADEMGASRTPVREALFILEAEGLVRRYPKLGVVVTELSLLDVAEAFQIREFVEPPAAAIAALALDKHRQELLALLDEFNALPGSSMTDLEKHLRHNIIDAQVHDLIIQAVNNKRLEDIMNTIRGTCGRARSLGTPMRFSESTAEHTALIQALLDRDPGLAFEHMRIHLANTRQRLLSSMYP